MLTTTPDTVNFQISSTGKQICNTLKNFQISYPQVQIYVTLRRTKLLLKRNTLVDNKLDKDEINIDATLTAYKVVQLANHKKE